TSPPRTTTSAYTMATPSPATARTERGRYVGSFAGSSAAGAVGTGAGRFVRSGMFAVPCPLSLVPPRRQGTRDKWLIVPGADVGGDVAEVRAAGGVAGGQAARLHRAGVVQVNLVLQNLLDDDRHLVAVAYFYERTGALVQHHHALLDQRR